MKQGPTLAARFFLETVDVSDAPREAKEWLVRIALQQGWYKKRSQAEEVCHHWVEPFLSQLRSEVNELRRLGRFEPFEFNSSSDYMLQGSAFVEPVDTPERKDQKNRVAHFNSYVKALQDLTPRHFEALCAGVVNKLGVSNPVLTRSSFDEGIDFYGKLRLEDLIPLQGRMVGVERQLAIWIIGQAKHYQSQNVSTFDIRDLVGAVELAKGRAFGMIASKYQDLNVRVCDPVFYFFITTGKMSSATWQLLEKGGVVGMDGHMVASFLAGHKVGLKGGTFHKPTLMKWIGSYLTEGAN